MKKFNKFLRERIDIRKTDISDDFIDQTEKDRHIHPRHIKRLAQKVMTISSRINSITLNDKEKIRKLEKLAYDVIMENYGPILEDVELIMKIVEPGNVTQEIDFEKKREGQKKKKNDQKKIDISDEELRKKITKAKIVNNIIQGEAKNVKPILNMETAKTGLKEIYKDDFDRVFKDLNELIRLADELDWAFPEEIKADMMKNIPSGFGGAVEVDWVPDDKDKEEDKDKDKNIDELINKLEKNELKDYNENPFEDYSMKPTIKAVGVDFSMLIHESVKGIYQLIAAYIIDNDEEIANLVSLNVETFEDEIQDFKYGPHMAAKLRDYINTFEDSDLYPNMREMIFGKMILLEDSTFIDLMNSILEDKDDPNKRKIIKDMIDQIKEEMSEYEKELAEYEIEKSSDYKDSDEDEDEDEDDSDDSKDYSKMSRKDLNEILDKALEDDDFETLDKIKEYL